MYSIFCYQINVTVNMHITFWMYVIILFLKGLQAYQINQSKSKSLLLSFLRQAQIALRNIECFEDFPARMQRRIAERGFYEK